MGRVELVVNRQDRRETFAVDGRRDQVRREAAAPEMIERELVIAGGGHLEGLGD